jgi:hypothetical protein
VFRPSNLGGIQCCFTRPQHQVNNHVQARFPLNSSAIPLPTPGPSFTYITTIPTSVTGNSPATAFYPSPTSSNSPTFNGWNPSTDEIVGLTFAIAALLAGLMVLWFFLKRRSIPSYPPQVVPTKSALPTAPSRGPTPPVTTPAPAYTQLPLPAPPEAWAAAHRDNGHSAARATATPRNQHCLFLKAYTALLILLNSTAIFA